MSTTQEQRIMGRHLDALIDRLHQAEDRNYTWSINPERSEILVIVKRKDSIVEYSVTKRNTTWRMM
jgi:hypothetical protein